VAALEERIAYLEGKVEEQSRSVDGVREAADRRFEALLRKLDALDQKLDQRTFAIVRELHERTDTLDQKISRQFVWLAGAQMTTLLAVAGAIVAAVLAR